MSTSETENSNINTTHQNYEYDGKCVSVLLRAEYLNYKNILVKVHTNGTIKNCCVVLCKIFKKCLCILGSFFLRLLSVILMHICLHNCFVWHDILKILGTNIAYMTLQWGLKPAPRYNPREQRLTVASKLFYNIYTCGCKFYGCKNRFWETTTSALLLPNVQEKNYYF